MNLPNKILIVTFEFGCSSVQLEEAAVRLAAPIANVPGLVWKLWLQNPEANSAGGVYMFASDLALQNFIDGPIATEIINRPEFHHVRMRVFDVLEKASRKTRAPLTLPSPSW